MFFAGLTASTLAAIGGGVAALTVLLYILKLRRRPVAVPFSPIWQRVLQDKQTTHLFSQLKRWLSLLLQLVLVGLLVLALGDPRLGASWTESRNIVVLVDGSASMQAYDVQPSRVEVARRELSKLIDGISGADRMLVAQMGPSPHPLSTMTDNAAELRRAAQGLRATDTRADFGRALRFAVDSLRGLSKPEIVVISDGALGDTEVEARSAGLGDVKLSYVPVGSFSEGRGSRNVAITQFSVRRYPLDKSRYEVLLELTNTTDEPVKTTLTLLGDGVVVDVTTLALGPGERLPRIYGDLAGASKTLEAKVELLTDPNDAEAKDELAADNHAYALMPERRRVAVLVVSAGNTYLQAALLLDEYLDVTLVEPGQPLPSGRFDVTILDGVAPELRADHGALLYLDPPADGAPIGHAREKPISDFGFDTWDKKSPLLSFIAPENIQVTTGHALSPGDGDKVVGASEKGPILVSGKRGGQPFVALGFDARNSDFVLRVAWPLFLLNTIQNFASEDVRYLSSFRTGEVWNIPAPDGLELANLKTPSGETLTLPVKNGYATIFGDTAGFYELQDQAGQALHPFAANLINLEESQITPVAELRVGAEAKAGSVEGFTPGVRRELWLSLVIAVAALSLIEWFSYHRRVTV